MNHEALTQLAVSLRRAVVERASTDSQNYSEDVGSFRINYLLKFGQLCLVPADLILPVVDTTFYTAAAPVRSSGIGDLTYMPTIAYYVTEDEPTDTHTYFALTPYVTLPTGNYQPAALLSPGDNRWRVQPTVVVGQRLLKSLTLELVGGVDFTTNNTQVGAAGPMQLTLKQDPTITVEAHVAADLSPTFFAAASYYAVATGKRSVALQDGTVVPTAGDPEQTIQTLRFTYGIHVEKFTTILLQLNQDIEASGGATIARFVGVRISHPVFF